MKKFDPFEKFGLYYKPSKTEFLTYYQDDLYRITLNLLSKRNLRLNTDKVEDFIQELNLKIAFRKEPGNRPSRLERYDPFRNIKKKFKIKSPSIFTSITSEEFARCISFKTYLYTIVKNYVANKAKQEASNKKKHGVSLNSNPDDPQLFIVNNSVDNYVSEEKREKIQSYLSDFENYLVKQCTHQKKQISLLTVWKCIKHSSRNREIVEMLQELYPKVKIKNTMVTRYLRKIRDHAQRFQHLVGSLEL